MDSSGLRRILRPVLYLFLAAGVHTLLLLLPFGGEGGKASGRMRGVRVKALRGGGSGEAVGSGGKSVGHSVPTAEARRSVPATPVAGNLPASGGGTVGAEREAAGTDAGGALRSAGDGIGAGESGASPIGHPGGEEYRSYLERLRSNPVQGWAKESAGKMRQEWSGSGKPQEGLKVGTAEVKTPVTQSGGRYLDPRVQMVVTSYPPTGIERRFTQVPYPDLKIRQHQVASGWWNVYIQIRTDGEGKVVRRTVLRPETDGPVEKLFVAQVQKEIDRWRFDPAEAEILVDVRFHVE